MKLSGEIVSVGRHDLGGEAIHGVLIEVPREQLQQGGLLYREVIVHRDYHARTENPEVLNVDLLERERDALAQKATALAVQVSEQTKRWDSTIRENERLTRERDEAREALEISRQRSAEKDLRIEDLKKRLQFTQGELSSRISELEKTEARVKLLEEAGDAMWRKAGPFIVRDVILDDGDTEVPIREVDPDFQIRDEESPTAREIVALIDAVDGWTQAKEATP